MSTSSKLAAIAPIKSTSAPTGTSVINNGVTPAPGTIVSTGQQAQQGGRTINLVVPAGQTIRAMSAGTQFYFFIATAPINARPVGGDFVLYQQGTGLNAGVQFAYVELQNPNQVPVVVSIFIGYGSFIDNRLILVNQVQPQIAYPTCSAANSRTQININDLSGGSFYDINGNEWLAVQRTCIIVFNADSGVTLLLQQAGSAVANGPAVGIIQPLTNIRFDFGGNYTLSVGGGNINAIVSEIYSAIAANTVE